MVRYHGDRFSFVAACVLLAATFLPTCLASAVVIRDDKKNTGLPQPISLTPDQNWDGIDGQWSTFPLRVGEPPQYIRALVSTASQQTWVVYTQACQVNQANGQGNSTAMVVDSSCADSRGKLFNPANSTTWKNQGFYQLWTEKNMGLDGNGQYGYDTVGVGYPGEQGPTLRNTTIGALITPNFWLGHFGVNAKSTNFSAFQEPSPSYMTYLFKGGMIPSVSFAYTAGAHYRFTSVLASLTLGGYDTSRYVDNDLTFGFAPDNERDIVVGVTGIHANGATRHNVDLLKMDPIAMYIDSTIAEIYLPLSVCKAFEDAFGLKYDEETDLYLVNDLLHQQLLAENATITFTLGQKFASNATVDIVFPYYAFDLLAKPPYRGLQNETKFFPIRRAANNTQYVLGRTFLQEAYLVVDWERQNFSLYQCSWTYGQKTNINAIVSPSLLNGTSMGSSSTAHRLTTGGIIGIAVGSGFSIAMIFFGIAWWFWRKRHIEKVKAEYEAKLTSQSIKEQPAPHNADEPPLSPTTVHDPEEGTNVFPKAELSAESSGRNQPHTDVKVDPTSPSSFGMPSPAVEVENTERQIFEMPGDIPVRLEADGRQLSEKESMMVRERIYNGVDPSGPSPISPTTEDTPRRLAPISPSEVAMVNRRVQPNVSPTTPRTPRDGASLEADDTFFRPPAPRTPRDGRFLEAEDTLLSPISPLEGSTDSTRKRFSYEVP